MKEVTKNAKSAAAQDTMVKDLVERVTHSEDLSLADARLVVEIFSAQANKAIDILEKEEGHPNCISSVIIRTILDDAIDKAMD